MIRTPRCITQRLANVSPCQWQLFLSNELDQIRTDIYFRDKEILYLIKLLILGGKRFELLQAIAIEFTAQPFLPIKEVSLIFYWCIKNSISNMFRVMIPVQLPLHEPYFDFTLIRTTHTKIFTKRKQTTYSFYNIVKKQTYCARSFQHVTSG